MLLAEVEQGIEFVDSELTFVNFDSSDEAGLSFVSWVIFIKTLYKRKVFLFFVQTCFFTHHKPEREGLVADTTQNQHAYTSDDAVKNVFFCTRKWKIHIQYRFLYHAYF